MSYYKEKGRATRAADHIINEALYIHNKEIDLRKLDLFESPKYDCNFMRIFKERLALYMEHDSNIKQNEDVVYYDKPANTETEPK